MKLSKFCRNCGTPLSDEATFCGKCGTPVTGGSGSSPANSSGVPISADKMKLGVIIASAVLILSTFLPYAKVSVFGFSQSVSLLEGGDGYFFIACAALAIVGVVINKQILTLVGGVVAALLSLFEIVNMKSELGELSGLVDMSMGFYLSLLASIVLAVFGILAFLSARKNR